LIHGAAGGVGTFAVQLAAGHGAHVIATASSRNLDFLSQIGAHEVIDYRTTRFEDKVKGVDVVLDTVGGDTLDRSWGVLSPQGRLVTVASSVEDSSDARVKNAFFIVEPDGTQLSRIAALLQDGSLDPVVDSVVPLSQAPAVYSGKLKRQGRGKIVVSVTSEKAQLRDAGFKTAARSYGAG
jgi:NADPH:quinone reductase-like Zn-dependent oxidoreductase